MKIKTHYGTIAFPNGAVVVFGDSFAEVKADSKTLAHIPRSHVVEILPTSDETFLLQAAAAALSRASSGDRGQSLHSFGQAAARIKRILRRFDIVKNRFVDSE